MILKKVSSRAVHQPDQPTAGSWGGSTLTLTLTAAPGLPGDRSDFTHEDMRSGEVQFVVQRCLEAAPDSGLSPVSLDTSPSPCTVQCGVSGSHLGLVPSSESRTQRQSSGKAAEAWRSGCPALRLAEGRKKKTMDYTDRRMELQLGEEGKGSMGGAEV